MLGVMILATVAFLVTSRTPTINVPAGAIGVRDFSTALFREYGLAVELISMQLLFALVGAVWRSNIIMMLIGIEIMLNATMLVFVGGAGKWNQTTGQVFALMIMALTSAEVSLALALVVYLHRRKQTVNADEFSEMKG